MLKYFTIPMIVQNLSVIGLLILTHIGTDVAKPYLTIPFGLFAIVSGILRERKIWTVKDENRKNILKAVSPTIKHILTCSSEQFSCMAIAAGKLEIKNVLKPTNEQIKEVLSNLYPMGQSVIVSAQDQRRLNWLEFMDYYNHLTVKYTDDAYIFISHLDSELATLLADLNNCYYFKEIQLLANGARPRNENLSFVPFALYQKKIDNLRNYYDKHLKIYGGGGTPHMAVIPCI